MVGHGGVGLVANDFGNPGGGSAARSKIRRLDELAALADQARREGRGVVLAHGVFDLLHLGHVRYLEAARRLGDMLVVTVTADPFVNKGPSRPVFTEQLRAEMLGALGCVDWVAVNHAPTAVNVIELLRPDVYVKGVEYKNVENDLTGKIVEEQEAVARHGGRIEFIDDITFSSSSLINQHMAIGDPKARVYLDELRQRGIGDSISAMFDRLADMRVLVVGETIIDEYHYVAPLGKPPKEFVLATLYRAHEVFAGGVIAAANHVASFCKEVEVLTCFGDQDHYASVAQAALKPNVKLWSVHRSDAPTIRKLRYVDDVFMRKLFEIYYMNDKPLPDVLEDSFEEEIVNRAGEFDVVIVTDFGHGLLSPRLRRALIDNSRYLAVNTQSNSANHGYNLIQKYSRADYVCIDAPEARLAVADKDAEIASVAGQLLPHRMGCGRLIVTQGRSGCVTYDQEEGIRQVPAFSTRIVDTMGAGDAFLAVTAPLASVAESMEIVGFIGNVVGAIKVGIVGHRQSVDKVDVLRHIRTLLK